MADNTAIEWTRHPVTGKGATWNPITGCTLVSDGCRHCYAARLAATKLKNHPSRKGLARLNAAGKAKFTGEVRFNEEWLTQPLRWQRPRMIFVCAHGDLFHENVPDEWIDRVFAIMALAPQHTFQVLTKRSARMREYMDRSLGRIADTIISLRRARGDTDMAIVPLPHVTPGRAWWPLPNVWLGVSAEDQATADERIPNLLATPAAIRFVSAEPLLGPIQFDYFCDGYKFVDALRGNWWHDDPDGPNPISRGHEKLDWIIVGGESGNKARPMHPDWARAIRDQCQQSGTAFFFKQWGSHSIIYDRDVEDPDWRQCDTIQRTHPAGRWLNLAGGHGFHGERVVYAVPTTKKHAGRLLDGVEHSEMPIPAGGQAPDRAPGDVARPAGAPAAREAQQ